ncbi:MAG: nucleoside phosphorylase [Clostridia bacterium]|nr:nucleoside phosphorylase [Clostridia bacterium]
MITDSFDNKSPAKINPQRNPDAPAVDACIMTFSYLIEQFVLEHYPCQEIAQLESVTGITPIYAITHNGKQFAFFKTPVGAPACAAAIESSLAKVNTDKYILFGGCGCLDKEIARGKVIVPTAAYRDEGTSYHYAPPADYISIPNASIVERFMQANGIPCAVGKTWTTDAFYRETEGNFARRKADGCLSVEMESAAAQAVCDFRGLELYVFFTSGDLLDAPKWDARRKEGQIAHTQHDAGHFDIALALADFVTE